MIKEGGRMIKSIDNVRSCCKQGNLTKNTLKEDGFYRWIVKINAAMFARF